MDAVVFAVIRSSDNTLGKSVTGLPVGREVDTGVVGDGCVCDSVLGQAGVLVHADGITLGAVIGLVGEVVCINGAEDIETVTVIGSHNDEGVIQYAERSELGNGCVDGVIKLEAENGSQAGFK